MVDGNVFVVRIITLEPQNGIQNTFAAYSAVSVSVLFVTHEWNECLAVFSLVK